MSPRALARGGQPWLVSRRIVHFSDRHTETGGGAGAWVLVGGLGGGV